MLPIIGLFDYHIELIDIPGLQINMTEGGDKQHMKYIQFGFQLHDLGRFPRLLSKG